jgi:hypothetical protein
LSTQYAQIPLKGDTFPIIADIDNFSPGTISLADKIKAAAAYCLSLEPHGRFADEPNSFVWSCGGFRALCEIKCNAVMSRNANNLPTRTSTEDVYSAVAVLIQMYVSLKASSAFARAEKRETAIVVDDFEMDWL